MTVAELRAILQAFKNDDPSTLSSLQYVLAVLLDYTYSLPVGGGITQLTGDVTAGPGAGSQVATVTGLDGNPVAAASPSPGDSLVWDGTQWAPAAGGGGGITELGGDIIAGPGTGLQNATVAGIEGIPVDATPPTPGQVLGYDGTWWTPTTLPADTGITELTGDVTAGPGSGSQAATVAALQGNPVSSVAPADGQVLTWNGSAWVPGAPASGGSGGGGQTYFFNNGTAGDSPLPAVGTKELGLVAETPLSSVTSAILPNDGTTFVLVAGFVTDLGAPGLTTIPAGIWDCNIWAQASGPSATENVVRFRLRVYKWDGTTTTLLSTSSTAPLYDPSQPIQYIASVLLPQTTVLATDRVYIALEATATANNHTITFDFGDARPSHVHTTIPSIAGTGLVHVINGVVQSPASPVDLTAGATEIIGTLPIGNGGTGLATTPTDGQLLIGKTSTNDYALATLTAGTNVTITNGAGSVTIDAAGSIGGTVAANEIAFGTGVDSIGGDAGFTFTGGTLEVNSGGAYSARLFGQVGINDISSGEEIVEFEPSLFSFNIRTDSTLDPGPGYLTTVEAGQVTVLDTTDSTHATTTAGSNLGASYLTFTDVAGGNTATITAQDGASNPFPLNLVIEELQVNANPGNAGEVLTSNGPNAAPTWQAGGGGGITQLTGDVVAGPGSGSQAATIKSFGGKIHWVVEGGLYATLQDAVNAASANDTILVGPKTTGTWGDVTLNVVNKPLVIAAISGAGSNKIIAVGSITYDLGTTGPVLNVNLNETYIYGLYIQGSFAGSAVTLTGGANYPGRLRLYGCYVLNTSAVGAAAITNSNAGANSSLYIDSCIVSLSNSAAGSAIVQTAGYTVIRNRSDVSGSLAVGATGNAINVSGGTIEIYDSYISISRAVPTINVTGATTFVAVGYSTVSNSSNTAGASCAYIGTSGATFGAGNATLAAGSSLVTSAVAVSGVAGGSFLYGNVNYSYATTVSTVTATATAQSGGLFVYGMSVGSVLGSTFAVNASGNITKINNVTTSFPAAQGSANQVLTNNGSGTLTWANGNLRTLGSVGATPTAANLRTNATYTVNVAAVALPAMAAGDDGLTISLVNISGAGSTVTPSTGVARTMTTGGGQTWVWRNTGTTWYCISNV